MKREREELIDYVLGELEGERARSVAERIAREPAAAEERDHLVFATRLVRQVAAEGWEAPAAGRGRLRVLRPALVAAAVLAVAVGLFFLNGTPSPGAIYDPDGAFGYLQPEETDAAGAVYARSTAKDAAVLRAGRLEISTIGSEGEYRLAVGETIPIGSEVKTPTDDGARIDLPDGGIVFLGPAAELRVRRHQAGGLALRLMLGDAATVAGERPLHLAVHDTDLLLQQNSGAALLRFQPAEAIALRGELFLKLEADGRFRVPEAERLPAACANAPRTAAVLDSDLELEWYRDLVYRAGHRVEPVDLESSKPLETGPATMIYLRIVPTESGKISVRFGGEPREFQVAKGAPLRLRLRCRDLGPGPHLEVSPSGGVKEARLFEAVPR